MTRAVFRSSVGLAVALTISTVLSVPPASAADLGVRGATWPVAEPDLLEQIEERLSGMRRSGELARIEREAQTRARSRLEEPEPVPGIAPAREARSRMFDPAITVERDIRLPDGTLIAASGTRVNPLARHSLTRDLLFVDGRREAEIAWALEHARPAKIVLLAGRPLDLARVPRPGLLLRPGRPACGPVRAAFRRPRWSSRPGRSCASPKYRSRTGMTPDRRPGQGHNPNKRNEPMLNMNRVTLLGHAGRDPEIRNLQNGGKAASFTLATTEKWKGKDGKPAEATEWHRIVVYGPTVEAVEKMLRKGDAVLVEGRIATRDYRDKDGNERTIVEIVVAGWQGTVNILAGRREGGGGGDADARDAGAPA